VWHHRLERRPKPATPEERWAIFQAEVAAVEPPDPLDPVEVDIGWTHQRRQRRQVLRQHPSLFDEAVALLVSELGGRVVS
jgi:hypothetical protein